MTCLRLSTFYASEESRVEWEIAEEEAAQAERNLHEGVDARVLMPGDWWPTKRQPNQKPKSAGDGIVASPTHFCQGCGDQTDRCDVRLAFRKNGDRVEVCAVCAAYLELLGHTTYRYQGTITRRDPDHLWGNAHWGILPQNVRDKICDIRRKKYGGYSQASQPYVSWISDKSCQEKAWGRLVPGGDVRQQIWKRLWKAGGGWRYEPVSRKWPRRPWLHKHKEDASC